MEASANFGQRYIFSSMVQCIAHQVSHHHYSLSASALKEDSIVLQVLIKNEWLETTIPPRFITGLIPQTPKP
eukprot:1631564-Amphidinium_carterae.1